MDVQDLVLKKGIGRRRLEDRNYERLGKVGHDEIPYNIVRLFKGCTATKDLHKGSKLHEYVLQHNYLRKNTYIGSSLVSMYAKCGALVKASQVLKELPWRDVASWNALIAGHTQQGQGDEALKCFDDMLRDGHSPNAVTFTCVLKACGSIVAAAKGEEIHNKIDSLGMLEKHIVLGNTLVDMYAKCGALERAHEVLEVLPMRDVVSWNALIGGHAQQGQGEEALQYFDDMLIEGHSPNAITFTCALKACGSIRAIAKGEEIHDMIASLGMVERDVVLGTAVVDMYAKCGELAKAHQVHKEIPLHDVVSWNALIAGHAQQGQGEEALKCFDDMLCDGNSPNVVTFACVLKACESIGATAKAKEIHGKIVILGMLEKHILLGNTLIDMYAKCGELAKAHQVLKEMSKHDVASWNALLAGYVQYGQGEEVLKCFENMLHEGHIPNAATFISVLKACGSIGAAAKGEEIHDKIVSLGMLEKDVVLGTTLVQMYAECGELAKANCVLKELPMRGTVSWTALVAGYAQQGQVEEALKCCNDMLLEGHCPDAITFTYALKACGSIGAAAKGKKIHDQILGLGMLEKDFMLGTTLVDMYAKCGEVAKAHRVLKDLPMHDVVSWNALIAGYAQHGQGEEVLKCFNDMLCEGHFPDAITFACVLTDCWSIGATAMGEDIHDKMVNLDMLEKDFAPKDTLVDL